MSALTTFRWTQMARLLQAESKIATAAAATSPVPQDQVAELSKGIEIDRGAEAPDKGCVGTLTELATNAAPATSTATRPNTRTDATTAGGHLVQARSDSSRRCRAGQAAALTSPARVTATRVKGSDSTIGEHRIDGPGLLDQVKIKVSHQ